MSLPLLNFHSYINNLCFLPPPPPGFYFWSKSQNSLSILFFSKYHIFNFVDFSLLWFPFLFSLLSFFYFLWVFFVLCLSSWCRSLATDFKPFLFSNINVLKALNFPLHTIFTASPRLDTLYFYSHSGKNIFWFYLGLLFWSMSLLRSMYFNFHICECFPFNPFCYRFLISHTVIAEYTLFYSNIRIFTEMSFMTPATL